MKKKTSIYFLIPLACVLAFGGYYWTFLKAHNAKEVARLALVEQVKKDKDAKAQKDADLAFENAVAARKVKDDAKKAKDVTIAAEKDAKLKRKEDRSTAETDADRLLRTIDEKKASLTDLTKELGTLEAQKKALAAEGDLILKTVAQAKENNTKALAEVASYQKAAQARREIELARIAAEKAAAEKK